MKNIELKIRVSHELKDKILEHIKQTEDANISSFIRRIVLDFIDKNIDIQINKSDKLFKGNFLRVLVDKKFFTTLDNYTISRSRKVTKSALIRNIINDVL